MSQGPKCSYIPHARLVTHLVLCSPISDAVSADAATITEYFTQNIPHGYRLQLPAINDYYLRLSIFTMSKDIKICKPGPEKRVCQNVHKLLNYL